MGGHKMPGDPVAFGAVTLTDYGQTAWLRWGMVHAAYHRQGWGRALLEARMEWIAERTEASRVRVATTKPVHGFFVHHGLETTGIVTNGLGPGLDRYDLQRAMPR